MQINAQIQRDAQKGAIDQQKAQTDAVMNIQKQRIVQQGMQEKNAMARQSCSRRRRTTCLTAT